MSNAIHHLPALPEIGLPESYYIHLAHQAQRAGDVHLHEAAKVGQYISLAMDRNLGWEEKLKHFRHVLKRHCSPPPFPDDDVWLFYKELADKVRQYCGAEALRLASTEDDLYATRLRIGQNRPKIEDDAETFFLGIMGTSVSCPDWFNQADWAQLKLLRDQWI